MGCIEGFPFFSPARWWSLWKGGGYWGGIWTSRIKTTLTSSAEHWMAIFQALFAFFTGSLVLHHKLWRERWDSINDIYLSGFFSSFNSCGWWMWPTIGSLISGNTLLSRSKWCCDVCLLVCYWLYLIILLKLSHFELQVFNPPKDMELQVIQETYMSDGESHVCSLLFAEYADITLLCPL
jgi:hypothetical protein